MKRIAFLSLLIASSSWASDLSGHWVGHSGQVIDVQGHKTACKQVEVTITQTADRLTTSRYNADCGIYSSSWGPDSIRLENGKAFSGNEEIGTFADDELVTKQRDGNVVYIYNLKLNHGAKGETLSTVYGTNNFVGTLRIEAELERE